MRRWALLLLALGIVPAYAAITTTMDTLYMRGSTSGTIGVQATAVAGSNTLTLPGRTATVATTTGTPVDNNCAKWSSGNVVDAGAACGTGTGAGSKGYSWPADLTVTATTEPLYAPRSSGTIDSVSYYTGGTSTPSFSVAIKINGTNVTGCSAITVNSATPAATNCTAANTFVSGDKIDLVTSSISGSPNTALVQINYH